VRVDPENLLFGRMNRRRLEAEALRDSLLAVCDRLEQRPGGPPDDSHSRRRMIYLKTLRADRSGFRTLFDAADPSIHVEKRTASTVAPQALYLMNGSLSMEGLQSLVGRAGVARGATEERIQALYRAILGRKATAEEVALGHTFIQKLTAEPAGPSRDPAELGPWETYAQALLLSNEFLFAD
jgi:Protein of unknown function (DUF1553)